jgi:hypothetical protein
VLTPARLKRWTCVLLALAVLATRTAAVAGFTGRVLFADQPVPGATVIATKGDRQVTTVTDEQGKFTFADLENGPWSIRVEMPTFVTLTHDVTIPTDPSPVWTLTLKSLEELNAEHPRAAASAVPAASPATGTTPPPATPPAAARPAATSPTAAAAVSTTNAPVPAVDQPGADANDGMVINGSVNNAAASPIAQSPAFGNNRRQGRSLYSGGIGFIYGNAALDSRPFAFGGVEPAKPNYQNARVTGSFGGPIKLSQTLRKDPTVFISFQHVGDNSASTQSAVLPTMAERMGDFSGALNAAGQPLVIMDPTTGLPFPGNIIPGFRISPQAQALLAYFPQPTLTGDHGINFQAPLLTTTNQTVLTTRLMQPLGTTSQINAQVSYQHSTTGQTTLFGFDDSSLASGVDAIVNWTRRATRNLTQHTRYQFTGVTNSTTPFFANKTNVSGAAGIVGNDQTPADWGPPALQFSTITGLSDAVPAFSRNDTNSGLAEATWTHGHHNVTFGGDARRVTRHDESPSNPRGSFTFTGAATGSDVADFLLGIPSTSSIAFGNADRQFEYPAWDAYVSDDWRFSPTLTLQLGVRWEFEGAPTEENNNMANLDVAPGFVSVAPVLAGNVGPASGQSYPPSVFHDDWNGLQPRLSFAWRPIPASSFLMRGGYGIYRNAGMYLSIDELLSQQPPLSTAFTVANTLASPLSLANGFLVPATGAANTFAVDPNLRVGESQSWQIMVQRDLWGFLTFTGSYLGTRGDHLLQEFLPNTYPAGAVSPCPACPAGFIYLTSGGHSLRNAGQWQLRWRLHRGLAASVQYTLAKATDNAGAFTSVSLSGASIAQNWLDLNADEGRSNFDQRHLVVGQMQYTTGIGLGNGGLMDGMRGRLLAGWTIAANLTAGSGMPFTPVYLAPVPGTGIVGSLRPSLTGVSTAPPPGYYLNPAAYTAPAPGAFGDAPRNSVSGPAQFSFDMSVARTFQLTNRLTLDWRIDATNVLNRETFTGVNAVFGGPQFGLPGQVNTPRKIVSTLRLRF